VIAMVGRGDQSTCGILQVYVRARRPALREEPTASSWWEIGPEDVTYTRGLSLVFLRAGSIRTGIVLIQAFLAHSQVLF
jgi:hypothetical protein